MRYVVLEVADDKYADWLVEDLRTQIGDELLEHTAVVGVFQVPTKFCNPADGHRGKKTQSGFTRGKKYGWWVCGSCKKPTEGWSKNLNAVLSSARNLLVSGHILGAAPASTPENSLTDPTTSSPTTVTTTTGQTT